MTPCVVHSTAASMSNDMIYTYTVLEFSCEGIFRSVEERICEQASYTLHHINSAKLFSENSAMARLRDILRDWGSALQVCVCFNTLDLVTCCQWFGFSRRLNKRSGTARENNTYGQRNVTGRTVL